MIIYERKDPKEKVVAVECGNCASVIGLHKDDIYACHNSYYKETLFYADCGACGGMVRLATSAVPLAWRDDARKNIKGIIDEC